MFDVGIVGTGPAGFMAALRLVELKPNIKVVMFEKGKIRSEKEAEKTREKYDLGENVNVTEGWGGAGAFSDGKYNLDETGRVGGQLVSGGYMSERDYIKYLHEACKIYMENGGDSQRLFGYNNEPERVKEVESMHKIANGLRMQLHTFPIQHLGTSNAHKIVENIREFLLKNGVEIFTECRVSDAHKEQDHWRLETSKGDYNCKKVIMCPGRSGATWFRDFCKKKGFQLENNGVDIGVRVETSQKIMEPLTKLFYESKIYYRGKNDDELRTFCMCPNGRVAVEEYRDTGIFCANGHTDPGHPSTNCNFSILQTQRFTKPFDDPLAYANWIAGLCTQLSGGVIVQRLGDLRKWRRSTGYRLRQSFVNPTCLKEDGAIPGDISLALPARFVHGIVNFIDALDALAPGLASADTLLYAPEIKFNAVKVITDPKRGYEIVHGMHAAGDGSGYTRGLNGASIQGLAVAEWISENI